MTAAVPDGDTAIRVHATNVTAIGATQLTRSLLPAIERAAGRASLTLFLPTSGPLATYEPARRCTIVVALRRHLPNAISRALECTLLANRFSGNGCLLVLGDIPLRCRGPQIVFVQNLFVATRASGNKTVGAVKYELMRWLFRLNARRASAVIVQTLAMKEALCQSYPELEARTHIVPQPVPRWLQDAQLRRSGRRAAHAAGLELVYPAAEYPHKNHQLLSKIDNDDGGSWPVSSLVLTVRPVLHPQPALNWIRCVGRLDSAGMLSIYSSADGLLFLSLSESFGFPLLEAMFVGLPIICPDLPYAHALCGEQAIYFDPLDIHSLRVAVGELNDRLKDGWWPDWTESLKAIPTDWDTVAMRMLSIARDQLLD